MTHFFITLSVTLRWLFAARSYRLVRSRVLLNRHHNIIIPFFETTNMVFHIKSHVVHKSPAATSSSSL